MKTALAILIVLAATSARADVPAKAHKLFSDGEAAYQQNHFEEAAHLFEASYQQAKRAAVQFNIAQSYRRAFETGKKEDHLRLAVDAYRAFVRDVAASPDRPAALRALADLEQAQADRDQAKKDVQTAMRRYDLGEYRQALDGFKQAYLKMESPPILFNIARCQERLGEIDAAIASYRGYLQFPDVPDRAETEQHIAALQKNRPAGVTLTNGAPADDAAARRRRNLAIGLGVAGGVMVVAVIVGLAVGLSGPSTHAGSLGAFAGTQ